MPTILKTKNSVTTTVVPTTLQQGELAVNITDKKMWVGNAATTPVLLVNGGPDGVFTSITDSGNLTFTGTGNRITGDFSNATAANRVILQTSTTDGSTFFAGIPNGTGVATVYDIYNNSDVANGAFGRFSVDSSTVTINSSRAGTGTFLPITFRTSNSERLRIDTSGNVGIGTSSPTASLTVSSASGSPTVAILSGGTTSTSDNTQLRFFGKGSAANLYAIGTDIADGSTGANFDFFDLVASTNRMRIDSAGNVGIGTASPFSAAGFKSLTLNGSTAGFLAFQTNGTNASYIYPDGSALNIKHIPAQPMVFYTSDTERMRIDSSGNLLVGTTTQISQGKGNIAFNGSSHQGLNLQETANQASAGFMYFQYNTTVLGTITRNAGTNAILYNTTSDVRLKQNIADSKPALKIVSDIKVRQYDWIGTDYHQDYGFIAQELAEVVSDVVTKGRTEEDTWAVDYGKLTPILVKAIQEQQTLINQLTTRLNALEGK